MEVNEGKMVTLNDNQRAAQNVCINVVGSQKAVKNVRLQTPNIVVPLHPNLRAVELEKLSNMVTVRKQPFPTGDDDECEDGQCLEVQVDIVMDEFALYMNFLSNLDEDVPGSLSVHIRGIHGGDHLYVNFTDSRLKLKGASVTTAIEDAGIDKMKELGVDEQHFRLRDIPKTESNTWRSGQYLSTNISQWLAENFGGSSQMFKMTGKMVTFKEDSPETADCTFRGDAPIDCLVDYPWGEDLDQDICITKVDAEEVADPVAQESKADSVAIDDLFDFDPTSFVSQIAHSAVQNPWISHSIVFGIVCVLPTILKAIIKKMASRRVRRRIMRPRMLSQNQEDENMSYIMMADDV